MVLCQFSDYCGIVATLYQAIETRDCSASVEKMEIEIGVPKAYRTEKISGCQDYLKDFMSTSKENR